MSLWYLNQDHSPPPFSDTEIPLQTGAAKNIGLPFPTAPQQKGYIPRRSETSAFLILFPATRGWG